MPRSPLKPLSSAVVLFLLCASSARAQNFAENHPGFWIEWVRPTQGVAGDVALGDADEDGDIDLFVLDGGALQLWRNNGRGEIEHDIESLGPTWRFTSIVAMDVDGDSHLDLVGSLSPGIAWLRGTGNGQFALPIETGKGAEYGSLSAVDLDADGRPEILGTVNRPGTGLDVLTIDRRGAVAIGRHLLDGQEIVAVNAADLNHDGRNDLAASAIVDGMAAGLVVLLNHDSGFEAAATILHRPFPVTIASADLDGDGDIDLVTGDDGSTMGRVINDGTGRSWSDEVLNAGSGIPTTVYAADTDLDGMPEVFAFYGAGGREGIFLSEYRCANDPALTNPRVSSFSHAEANGLAPNRVRSADLNGDGRLDLVTASNVASGNYWDRPKAGMVSILLTPPDGRGRGIALYSIPVRGYRLESIHLGRSGPSQLVIAGVDGMFLTSLRRADWSLAPPLRIGDGDDLRVVDLDRDGRDDVVASIGWDSTEVSLTSSTGIPGNVVARLSGQLLALGDLDRDHRPDLLLRRGWNVQIVWNDSRAGFRRTTSTPIVLSDRNQQVLIGDVDGDGHNELIEIRMAFRKAYDDRDLSDTIRTYHVTPQGRLRLFGQTVLPSILDRWVDIAQATAANLDGNPGDEIVLAVGGQGFNFSVLHVFHALSDGHYFHGAESYLGGESPTEPRFADLDGDGDLDLACTTGLEAYRGVLQIRWNDGSGNLTASWRRRLAASYADELAIADFDGDGISDIAVHTFMPYQWADRQSHVAFLFGRRDEVSAHGPDLTFASASPVAVPSLAIRDISPNPARGPFTICWTARPDQPVDLEMHDVAGRRVQSAHFEAGGRETRFDPRRDLPAGLYWIRIQQGTLTATRRVVLVK